jgi:hypothetical protein
MIYVLSFSAAILGFIWLVLFCKLNHHKSFLEELDQAINELKEKQLFIVRVDRDEKFIAELAKLAQKTITIRDEILKL